MEANLKYKNSAGQQISTFPSVVMNITQNPMNDFSHKGAYSVDNASTGDKKLYAPVDLVCVKNNGTPTTAGATYFHTVEKVLTPSGLKHYTLALTHDNTAQTSWIVGKTYLQGEHIYNEGDAGYATGIHVHIDVGDGHQTTQYLNSDGVYCLTGQVMSDTIFYKNKTIIVKENTSTGQQLNWKTYTGEVLDWIAISQVYLSEAQSLHNAQIVVNHFYHENSDWTKEAICALLGNMRHESTINPRLYEMGYDWAEDRGYGLVQWTPRSKLSNWADGLGLDYTDGNVQLQRIDYEVENNIQWIGKSDYGNMTFSQFRQNSGSWTIDYLTESFTWCYERPTQSAGWGSMEARKAFANLCVDALNWDGNIEPEPEPDKKNDIMMLYLMDIIRGGFNGKF